MTTEAILEEIYGELSRAEVKHPGWPENHFEQLTIVNEEIGEANRALLHYYHEKGGYDHYIQELIETAAMCVRVIKNFKAKKQ